MDSGGDAREEERLLVQRLLAGDEAAFETLADDYFPPLYRFAQSRLRGGEAERELVRDLVQATVVKAIDKLDSFRGDSSLLTWLCACCRHEILHHFRRQSRRPELVELDPVRPPREEAPLGQAPGTPDTDVLRAEERTLVHRTLDELPPKYGKVLEWKYIDGLPVKEIAAKLNVGAKAAESILTRAREAFRKSYDRLTAAPFPGLAPLPFPPAERAGLP